MINNRYQILQKLRDTKRSSVSLAKDTLTGKELIVKTLKEAYPDLEQQFKILAGLKHPNLSQVLGLEQDQSSGKYFYIIEHFPGRDLSSIGLELSLQEIIEVLVQTCRALCYIHSRGLIHYDIKPTHILVLRSQAGCHVKLIDLGLMERRLEGGEFRGTIEYVCPEIVKGEPADHRADIYSLGISIYHALTHQLPYRVSLEASPSEILDAHIVAEPLPLRELRPDLPEGLERIIMRCLAKEPLNRYFSASEIILAINELLGTSFKTETIFYPICTRFIGRQDELFWLGQLLDEVPQAKPIILMNGETGIGKSRLIGEFASMAASKGFNVINGYCRARGASPYQPIIDILDRLLRYPGIDGSRVGLHISNLVSGPKRPCSPPESGLIETGIDTLLYEIAHDLINLSLDRPLLLVIEDIHQADRGTIEFVRGLARHLSARLEFHPSKVPLLICMSKRHEEPMEEEVKEVLNDISRQGWIQEVKLVDLSQLEVAEMVRSMLGDAGSIDELSEVIYSWAGGNPYLVHESIKVLIDEKVLTQVGQTWQIDIRGCKEKIGSSFEKILRQRWERLSEQEKVVFGSICMFGAPLNYKDLKQITGITDDRLLRGILVSLEERGLLNSIKLDEYSAHHDLLIEAIARLIPPVQRRWLHTRLAQALEEDADKSTRYPELLAYHFTQAGLHQKAYRYHLALARKLCSLFNYRRAVSSYEIVWDLEKDTLKRIELVPEIAEAMIKADEPRKAIQLCNQAITDLENTLKDEHETKERIGRLQLQLAEALLANRQKDYSVLKAIQEADRCLRGAETLFVARVEIAFGLYYFYNYDSQKALQHYQSAQGLLDTLPEREEHLWLWLKMGITYNVLKNNPQTALCYLQRVLDSKLIPPTHLLKPTTMWQVAVAQINIGRLDLAEGVLKDLLTLLEQTGYRSLQAKVYYLLAHIYIVSAQYPKALQNNILARTISKELGFEGLIGHSINQLAQYYSEIGEPSMAIDLLIREIEAFKDKGLKDVELSFYSTLSTAYWAKGMYQQAKDYIELGLKLARDLNENQQAIKYSLRLAAFYKSVGQDQKAAQQFDLLAKLPETEPDLETRYHYKEVKGLILESFDPIGAIESLKDALKGYLEIGIPAETGRLAFFLGRIYFNLNDLDKASELWEQCDKIAREKGLVDLKARSLLLKAQIESRLSGRYQVETLRALEDIARELQRRGILELSWHTQHTIGKGYYLEGRLEEAREWMKRALDTASSITERLPEDWRGSYLSTQAYKALRQDLDRLLKGPEMVQDLATELAHEIARATRWKRVLCLMLAQIDQIDSIRIEYGERRYKQFLDGLLGFLKGKIRAVDIVRKVREGIGFILPETTKSDGIRIGDRFRRFVAEFGLEQGIHPLSLSLGLVCFPADGSTPEELIKRAKEALRCAREGGGDRVFFFGEVAPSRRPEEIQQLLQHTTGRAVLSMLARLLQTEFEPHAQLDLIVAMLIDAIKAERGFIAIGEQEPWEFISARGLSYERIKSPEFEVSYSIIREVINSQREVLIHDALSEPRFSTRESVVALGLRSVLVVPILDEGRVIGIIYLDNRSIATRFTGEELEVVRLFADKIAPVIRNLLEIQRQREELDMVRSLLAEDTSVAIKRYDFGNIVSRDERFLDILNKAQMVSSSNLPVLLLGESGTGKELIARAIHYHSPRANKPFVVINCAALTETLLESELFGHVKGAFTGAITDRKGKFQTATGGTVFLDEIAEMSPYLQAKLLRVLQFSEVQKVGSDVTTYIDIRVIAATNKDLEGLVKSGRFREDLYYRLSVVRLCLPPLRDRRQDIPLLIEYFLQKIAKEIGKQGIKLSTQAREILLAHDYPGNVRELENLLAGAAILAKGTKVTPNELPSSIAKGVRKEVPLSAQKPPSDMKQLSLMRRVLEKNLLIQLLKRTKGNIAHAAKLAKIDRPNFHRLLRKHSIDPQRYRM